MALSGSFDVVVDDGEQKKTFTLNRSYYGLYFPAGLWRTMKYFSTNSLALEFGLEHCDDQDYIRDYEEYLQFKVQNSRFKVDYSANREPLTTTPEHGVFNVFDCTMVELDKHHIDRKGNLTIVENGKTLPFDVKRVYYSMYRAARIEALMRIGS